MFYKPLSEVVRSYRDWATSDHPRLPTGYAILDSRTSGGAASGEVILFQCRSQVGKTTFGINMIANNIGRPAAFFSLEMHARYVAARLAAIHTNTPTSVIEAELKEFGRSDALAAIVKDYPTFGIPDKPAMSLKQMGEALDEFEDVWGQKTELVVIDFLELIGGVPSLSAVEKIDGLTRKVKDFARERDCVVLLLHQVGRGAGGTGDEPLDITSSRYGGEVSADYVLGAYRPCLRKGIAQDEYLRERSMLYLQFLKTRGGSELHPQGLLHHLNPETLRISEKQLTPLWGEDNGEEDPYGL